MPVACVIHWSGLHGAAVVEAARRSRARRRACWRAVLGTGTGAQGLVCVRVQEKGEPRRGAGLCRRGITTAEQRRSNGGGTPGMVFWRPEWPTRHYSVLKRKRGVGKCSPRPEIEQGGRAGEAASMASGGAWTEFGDGAAAGRLRSSWCGGSTRGVLTMEPRGSGGPGIADGMKLQ